MNHERKGDGSVKENGGEINTGRTKIKPQQQNISKRKRKKKRLASKTREGEKTDGKIRKGGRGNKIRECKKEKGEHAGVGRGMGRGGMGRLEVRFSYFERRPHYQLLHNN